MGNCFSGKERVFFTDLQVKKGKLLASGGYGDVWMCSDEDGQRLFALKAIRLQSPALQEMYLRESSILKRCSKMGSKRIIKLFQSNIHGEVGYLLLELGRGTLLDTINQHKLTHQKAARSFLQIIQAVEELHSLNVYHLDIKPQNFIQTETGYKLCDLGSAIEGVKDLSKISRAQRLAFIEYIQSSSTLMYRSPEMVRPEKQVIGPQSDVWMVGCVGYFLLERRHAFAGQGPLAIMSGHVELSSEGWLQQLILRALTVDQSKRISLERLKNEVVKQLSLVSNDI